MSLPENIRRLPETDRINLAQEQLAIASNALDTNNITIASRAVNQARMLVETLTTNEAVKSAQEAQLNTLVARLEQLAEKNSVILEPFGETEESQNAWLEVAKKRYKALNDEITEKLLLQSISKEDWDQLQIRHSLLSQTIGDSQTEVPATQQIEKSLAAIIRQVDRLKNSVDVLEKKIKPAATDIAKPAQNEQPNQKTDEDWTPEAVTNHAEVTAQINAELSKLQTEINQLTASATPDAVQALKSRINAQRNAFNAQRNELREVVETYGKASGNPRQIAEYSATANKTQALLDESSWKQLEEKLAETEYAHWEKFEANKIPQYVDLETALRETPPANTDSKVRFQSLKEYIARLSGLLNNLQRYVSSLTDQRQQQFLNKAIAQASNEIQQHTRDTVQYVDQHLETIFEQFNPAINDTLAHILSLDITSLNKAQLQTLLNKLNLAVEQAQTIIDENNEYLPDRAKQMVSRGKKLAETIDTIQNQEKNAEAYNRLAGSVRDRLALLLREPRTLTVDNDIIAGLFKDSEYSQNLNAIRTMFDKLSDREKKDFKELEKQIEITKFKIALWFARKTIESYENNNADIGKFYSNKDSAYHNHGMSHAADAANRIEQLGYPDLAKQMKAKQEAIDKNLSRRAALMLSQAAMKVPLLGIEQSVRNYPDSAGYLMNNEMFAEVLKEYYHPLGPIKPKNQQNSQGQNQPERSWSPELLLPEDKELNPHLLDGTVRMKVAHALPAGAKPDFMGQEVISKNGEWATIRTSLSTNDLLMMMVHEVFSSKKFRVGYHNYHTTYVFENMHGIIHNEIMPRFFKEVVEPMFIEDAYITEHQQPGKKFAGMSKENVLARKGQWSGDPEFKAMVARVKAEFAKITSNDIKQITIAYLQTLLPQTFSEGGSLGLADNVWYSQHLNYLLSDFARGTKDMRPFRALMFALPESPHTIWDMLDTQLQYYRDQRQGLKGMALDIISPQAKPEFSAIINATVDRFCHHHGLDPGYFSHITTGRAFSIPDTSMIDSKNQHVDTKSGVPRTKFSGRSLAPQYLGFRSTFGYPILRDRNNVPLKGKQGDLENIYLTPNQLVDEAGFLRFDLYEPERMHGDMLEFLNQVGAKIKNVYAALATPGDTLKKLEGIFSSADGKEAFYAAFGMPEVGAEVMLGILDAQAQMQVIAETFVLADVIDLILQKKDIHEIMHMVEGLGRSVTPDFKHLMEDIVNNLYAQEALFADLGKSFSDQVSKAFKFE